MVGSSRRSTLVRESIAGPRRSLDRHTIHVHDMAVGGAMPSSRSVDGSSRTLGGRTGRSSARRCCARAVRSASSAPYAPRSSPFTEQQIALLETFADQAVIAIENARLFEELQDRVGELQALGEVGQAVSSSLDLQEVLTTIVAQCHPPGSAPTAGSIYEYDEAEGVFEVRARRPDDRRAAAATVGQARFRLGESAVGRAAHARRRPGRRISRSLATCSARDGPRARCSAPGFALGAGRPARCARSASSAGWSCRRKTPGAFPPEVVALLQTFATQSALAIDNARLYPQAQ